MRGTRYILGIALLAGLLGPGSASAAPGQIDPAFTSEGFNVSGVSQAKFLADGDIMVSGSFDFYGSVGSISGLVRLNPSGTPDPSFGTEGTGFEDTKSVLDFFPRSDGKVWAVGSFADFNGAPDSSHVVLLNSDGTRDTSFDTDHVGDGSGFNGGDIWAVEEMADSDILIGGTFTDYGNVGSSGYLVRLNPNGTVDSSWAGLVGLGTPGGGADVSVFAIDRCPNGKFMVGGFFFQFNGDTSYHKVLRLNADGSLDTTFKAVGTGLDGGVISSLHCQGDGKVLVGGNFGGYNGTSRPNLLRLNANGSLDADFIPPAPDTYVLAIEELPTGKLAIGGLFTTIGGQTRNYIAQLNADGSLDGGFAIGSGFCGAVTPPCGFPRVNSLEVTRLGSLLVAGEFRSYNGTSTEQVAMLYDSARVSTTVNGLGTVTSSPAGISCPGTCSAWFDQGQTVGLTATPAGGSVFSGWSGGCTGTGACSLAANSNSVEGTFTAAAPNPNPDPSPNPSPDPTTPSLALSALKAKVKKRALLVSSKATVNGAGKIAQRATTGSGKKTKTWCRASKSASAAGTYTLKCNLGKKGRSALRKQALKLTLRTTFTPTAGEGVAVNRKLNLKRRR